MPYDPQTGEWKDENASVSQRVTGLLSQQSPLQQQARTQGLQAAARRGLLNSSMAVQAAQTAAYAAALPIAQQEASQAHQRNLSGQEFRQSRTLLSDELTSRERMQERDIGAQRERLEMEIGSRERMQQIDIQAQREFLERELGSRERLQEAELAAQKERLGMQLSSQERMALEELRAAEQRLSMQLSVEQQMQQREIALREMLGRLDADTRERIAGMEVLAQERQSAAQLAASFENAYMQLMANIVNNPELPANVRQQFVQYAAQVRDSNLALIEQMYGIDLRWQTPMGQQNTGGATGGSTGGGTGGTGGQTTLPLGQTITLPSGQTITLPSQLPIGGGGAGYNIYIP